MDVLDVMRDRSNICKYLDMPLQHGSTRMLTRMRRGITQEKTERLVQDIRERVPGIAIRTTLIAGFPGETEEDHEDGLRWIERMRFDRLGCFTYSHEEDTHAHTFEDDVPFEVKQQRANEMMEVQGGISYELNQAKVGRTFRVLVDKAEGGFYHARTEHDSPEVDNDVLIRLLPSPPGKGRGWGHWPPLAHRGILYVPVKDTLYFAWHGGGAYRLQQARNFMGKPAYELAALAERLPVQNHRDTFTIVASRSHSTPETEAFIKEKEAAHGPCSWPASGAL